MKYISLFSGIEAVSCAWVPLGWEPVAFAEIDRFPSAVLAHRFPDVPNLGDMTKVDWSPYRGSVDIVVGGSPCQSFSIAGGRESLDGESRLMFEYIRAVSVIRPRWLLWENVPGVLSTRDNAFGQLLEELEKLGYGLAWRTLDSQFFGVAQRRRRVFLVGCLGNVGAATAVLFDAESVRGNTQTSKQKRAEFTGTAKERATGGGECLAFDIAQITHPENRSRPEFGNPCYTLSTQSQGPLICVSDNAANAAIDVDMCGTLRARGGRHPE